MILPNRSHEDTEKASVWLQREERGSSTLLLFMTKLSLLIGRRFSRVILYPIALYFLAAVKPARIASREFLTRSLNRRITLIDIYKHILAFTTTIHDRVYLLSDRFDLFEIKHFGTAELHNENANNKGVFLFGAHLGSFEVLHSFARANPHIHIFMAMYPENARQINRVFASINMDAMQNIIALGQLDAMLKINQKLQDGALVGLLADRASGPSKHETFSFLGRDAHFPCGPFRMAVMLKYPIYFMGGLYRGDNRYEIHFELLEDFSQPLSRDRDAAVRGIMAKYVATLERYCVAAPFNWFNFFDFWGDHRPDHA